MSLCPPLRNLATALGALLLFAACQHAAPRPPAGASAAAATAPAVASATPVAPVPAAHIAPWGVDLTGMDTSARPGDDFDRYVNGHWQDVTQIPADRSRWGAFMMLRERSLEQMHEILEGLPADAAVGTNTQKLHDFYRAYLDTDAIERRGLEPARPLLTAISSATTPAKIAYLMGRPDLRFEPPIQFGTRPDEEDPDHYMVTVSQGGLGLPDRDYYLKNDAVYKQIRAKYAAHIERLMRLAGESDPPQAAKSILDLETQIAQAQWPRAKRRERDLTYNPHSREQLPAFAPGFAWTAALEGAELQSQPTFIVRESDAIQKLAALFHQVPVKRWQSYLTYHYLVGNADVLPKAIDDEVFDFYGRTLNGQPQQEVRWKRAVAAVNSQLGEAAGELYVQRYFPPESKQMMLELVENLRATYKERIEKLSWMGPETRQKALEKLAAFHPKIGYPARWRDYSALQVLPGDAFGNIKRGVLFEWQRQVSRLGGPTDRGEWGMTPQTVNAYYNSTFNEVVFPAAILQAPFFDPHADLAVNYGGIGGVIGHEMGHGFDDQGAKSDARGVLTNWWQPQDAQAFHQRVDRLDNQYSAFEALPGLQLNGRLELGENIGDLGGLSVSYAAYHRALHGAAAPALDGFSGDQRFFLGWAQVWRQKQRDENLRTQVTSDPHSPAKFRVNGVVRNVNAWYPAFDVQPGEKLYLPADERVHIW
jgi:predicted metalloendopeptidase